MKVKELNDSVSRETEGIKCFCGGYAERVNTTLEERKKYGCGRSWECCARAFVCCLCNIRLVGSAEAPEME
jgi:hypothetical protein